MGPSGAVGVFGQRLNFLLMLSLRLIHEKVAQNDNSYSSSSSGGGSVNRNTKEQITKRRTPPSKLLLQQCTWRQQGRLWTRPPLLFPHPPLLVKPEIKSLLPNLSSPADSKKWTLPMNKTHSNIQKNYKCYKYKCYAKCRWQSISLLLVLCVTVVNIPYTIAQISTTDPAQMTRSIGTGGNGGLNVNGTSPSSSSSISYGNDALEDVKSTLSKKIMANTSLLLDSLLSEENYDRRIRPGFGGNATEIVTDVEIRSFGPVSENDMMYSMDCYFRQSWRDERLKFEGSLKKLSVSWQFLERIWTPDTYINNGKSSYLHKVTVPNKFIRLQSDGTLKYSMRLTIRAKCPMHLRKYPLDTQACPLKIGSYAYSPKDVVFRWNGGSPVVISKDVTLSQYEFVDILSDDLTVQLPNGETRSTLVTRFILRRRRGYFILQIYAPCSMIVGASWVAFWINRNDAAGRVAVGATTVLTLVTMGFGGRASLPKVNYATALDWFVVMCFSFVFAALVEYACVNYIERYMTMKQKKLLEARNKYEARFEQVRLQLEKEFRENGRDPGTVKLDQIRLRLEREAEREEEAEFEGTRSGFLSDFKAYCRKRRRHKYIQIATRPESEDALTPHEISGEVDAWARIIFPLTFTLFMLSYWALFLYLVDDEIDYSSPAGGVTAGVPLLAAATQTEINSPDDFHGTAKINHSLY
ncbi:gamma-aminobutyric acid receptor subunit alpha-6-like isoform X1 [Varroa jacobsoni]|uniref:Uncharacterized protein n=2 Tax=Varroa destructor TaxID=109461 RepID=A0A7M7MGH4_VARDE|nr:gamma-aminobutyric acid receptor subunit alpha-6-like isoform X1 [Varroa destructor]XP_022707856.1 gamma-aminobutyric acid receptor subunit alpha-6-like isoform X1 [Varroa jacobsoni]